MLNVTIFLSVTDFCIFLPVKPLWACLFWCLVHFFLTSTSGHLVNTASHRVFVAQRPFLAKHVAPPDHLAIQNATHTSFL